MNTRDRDFSTRHQITACLLRWGWVRDDGPADEIGECLDYAGCYRVGRWTKAGVTGNYCAQHAHQSGPTQFGGHD